MTREELQQQCEQGQALLEQTEYLQAEAILSAAESHAWAARDFDSLARLYMPLQEARRQIRQRCLEGEICLDLLADSPADAVEARRVLENYPQGMLLVAGWGTIAPAVKLRELQAELGLYVQTLLGAVYPTRGGQVIVIAPLDDMALPPAPDRDAAPSEDLPALPPHCIVLRRDELPAGSRRGDWHATSQAMGLWERLHSPFLAVANATPDPVARIEAYRQCIRVDRGCELAHQKLADTAHNLARDQRPAPV